MDADTERLIRELRDEIEALRERVTVLEGYERATNEGVRREFDKRQAARTPVTRQAGQVR